MKINPFNWFANTMQPQKARMDPPERLEQPHLGLDPDPILTQAKAEERFHASDIARGSTLLATGKDPQTAADHQAINKAAHENPGLVKPEFFKHTPITGVERFLPDFLKRK